MAKTMARELRSHGSLVVAIGSRSQGAADQLASSVQAQFAFDSYEALVSCDAVDIIYVATPNVLHLEHARLAINARKHVLIEKPVAMNEREAGTIFRAADATGVVALEGHWTRWLPHMVRLRRLLAQQALGELRYLQADFGLALSENPSHRVRDPLLGGGALLDLGVYPVAFALEVLGTPTSIEVDAAMDSRGVDTGISVMFSYEGGASALLRADIDATYPNRAVVVGTDGIAQLGPAWHGPSDLVVSDRSGHIVERFDGSCTGVGLTFEIAAMERSVQTGTAAGEPMAPGASLQLMATIDEIRSRCEVTKNSIIDYRQSMG